MKQEKVYFWCSLSGSVLMVMLVSTLLFVPWVNSLQADITSPTVVMQIPQKEESAQTSDMKLASLKTLKKSSKWFMSMSEKIIQMQQKTLWSALRNSRNRNDTKDGCRGCRNSIRTIFRCKRFFTKKIACILFDSLYYLHFQAFWMVSYGGRSSAGRALVCESSCRGFRAPSFAPYTASSYTLVWLLLLFLHKEPYKF